MRAIAMRLGGAAALCLAAVVVWLGLMQTTGNFHSVVPGELYRSA